MGMVRLHLEGDGKKAPVKTGMSGRRARVARFLTLTTRGHWLK